VSHTVIFPLSRLRTASDQVDAVMQETVPSVRYIRTSAIALLVAVSYYAGSQIGFLLTPAQSAISTFWPPNAILLAAFLLTPPRIWWVSLLAVMPAHLAIQLRNGIPLLSSLDGLWETPAKHCWALLVSGISRRKSHYSRASRESSFSSHLAFSSQRS